MLSANPLLMHVLIFVILNGFFFLMCVKSCNLICEFFLLYCHCLYTLSQTFLSTRQGAWVISRMSSQGLPLDMIAITRLNNILTKLLPRTLVNWAAERSLNQKYDHRLYGLQPRHRWCILTWLYVCFDLIIRLFFSGSWSDTNGFKHLLLFQRLFHVIHI